MLSNNKIYIHVADDARNCISVTELNITEILNMQLHE